MKNFIKNNSTLLLGLSIPVVMTIALTAVIYLPAFFIHPHTNFLYETGDNYYNGCQIYDAPSNKLIYNNDISTSTNAINCGENTTKPVLYIYNVADKTSIEVTQETAQALTLSNSAESPDGFMVVSNGMDSSLYSSLFGEDNYDYNNEYLTGHGYSSKINLAAQNVDYYNRFHFLGWITN